MTELIPLFSYLERFNAMRYSVNTFDIDSQYQPTDGFEPTPGDRPPSNYIRIAKTRKSIPDG